MSVPHKNILLVVVAFLLCSPVFINLSALPVRFWDEARVAINSLEMLHDHNWLVTHYDGKPEMWNTKPPLLIWIQVVSLKIFGENEFAIRLPSVIAAFMTFITLILFFRKFNRSYISGAFSIVVLFTINGYLQTHGVRNGDYEALLTLFVTTFCLAFFLFTETNESHYIKIFFIAFAGAIFAKGITPFLFLPAIVIYALFGKKLKLFLINKTFFTGLLLLLFSVMMYYLMREKYNPGYLKAVWQNELGGRYLSTLENNSHDNSYYLKNLFNYRLSGWYLLLPAGLIAGWCVPDEKIRRLTLFLFIILITYLGIISFSKTKCEWYDLPMFPFIAMIIASFLNVFYSLHLKIKLRGPVKTVLAALIIITFYEPYRKAAVKCFTPRENSWETDAYHIEYFLRDAIAGHHDLSGDILVHDAYIVPVLFYIHILKDKGIDITWRKPESIEAGDTIITDEKEIQKNIDAEFINRKIQTDRNIIIYKIIQKSN